MTRPLRIRNPRGIATLRATAGSLTCLFALAIATMLLLAAAVSAGSSGKTATHAAMHKPAPVSDACSDQPAEACVR